MIASTRYEIIGGIIGPIWLPGPECWKPVNVSYDRAQGPLREMALRAIDDEDFQTCRLTGDSVLRITREKRDNGRMTSRSRWWNLTAFPSIADCVAADKFIPDWA